MSNHGTLSYILCVPKPDRTWELACHLAALLLLLPHLRAANVWGPLVVWLIRRHADPAVDWQGRAALNFQLTMTIVFAALWLLAQLLGRLPGNLHHTEGAMWVLMRAWEITNLYFIIKASYKVGQGEPYNYPFSWKIIPVAAGDKL